MADMLRQGYLNLLGMGLRLAPDGLAVVGLPCPTFVWVNSGTHGRKPTRPYGNELQFDYVAKANTKLLSIGCTCFFHIWGCKQCCEMCITYHLVPHQYNIIYIYILVLVQWSQW